MKLSQTAFQNAASFIQATARPLDQRLFAYHFAHMAPEDVLDALSAYQHPDGGFCYTPQNGTSQPPASPWATAAALRYCTAVGAPSYHPLVSNAIVYLIKTFDPDKGCWPLPKRNTGRLDQTTGPYAEEKILDETTLIAPSSRAASFWPDLTPELASYLFQHVEWVPHTILNRVSQCLEKRLDHGWNTTSNQDILFSTMIWERALPFLPTYLKDKAQRVLQKQYQALEDPFPLDNLGTLRVFWLAKTPDSIFSNALPQTTTALFSAEIIQQENDNGVWPDWIPARFFNPWNEAQRAWAGKMTVDLLVSLQHFGRIEHPIPQPKIHCPVPKTWIRVSQLIPQAYR